MTLMIPCSHCGERPVAEFAYGEIPRVPEEISDPEAWDLDRAFMLNNPEGVQQEAWFHTFGCRRWSYLYRDTTTDQFVPPPGAP